MIVPPFGICMKAPRPQGFGQIIQKALFSFFQLQWRVKTTKPFLLSVLPKASRVPVLCPAGHHFLVVLTVAVWTHSVEILIIKGGLTSWSIGDSDPTLGEPLPTERWCLNRPFLWLLWQPIGLAQMSFRARPSLLTLIKIK